MPNLTNQLYKILKGLSYDTLNLVFSKDDKTGEYSIDWDVVLNLSDVTNSDKFGDDTKWGGDDSSFDVDKLINNAEKLIGKVKKKEDRETGRNKVLPNGVEKDPNKDPFGLQSLSTAKANYSDLKKQASQKDSTITKDELKGAKSGLKLARMNTAGQAMSAISDVASAFIPDRPEYSGKFGSLSQGLDKAYDALADGVAAVPVFGTLASGIMKSMAMTGKLMGSIGGGTSGMTATDAILGSSFLNMTPIGLINGFGGKTTDTLTKNEMAFSQVGNSYTGSSNKVDSAIEKSGKKYGFFSMGAFKDAQEEIAEGRRLQDMIESIGDEATKRGTLQANMTNTYANRYALNTGGGYLQNISVGRKGIELNLNKGRLTLKKYQSGGNITISVPITPITPTTITPSDLSADILLKYIEPTYVYPTYLFESEESEENNNPNIALKKYQSGGTISTNIDSIIEITDLSEDIIPMYQDGGSVNIIPDGALHKELHHMEDADNLTRKGIPIVGLDGELIAEIEKAEIILRLDVIKEIESNYEKYYNDETSKEEKDQLALNIGKMLVDEILHNTIDLTKNIL